MARCLVLLLVALAADSPPALLTRHSGQHRDLLHLRHKHAKSAHGVKGHHRGLRGLVRAVNGQEVDTPTEYIRTEVDRLRKARDDMSIRMQANKDRYSDDVKEIDRLVDEQHHFAASAPELKEEVAGVESEMTTLKGMQKIYAKANDTRAETVAQEVKDLEGVLESLQSNSTDGEGLIKKITEEGEMFFRVSKKETSEVAVLDKEVKGLERKLMDAEEREEGNQGILDQDDDGDEEDSARGLEAALGSSWKEDDLEEKATAAEESLNKAISHKPIMGQMMGMMR